MLAPIVIARIVGAARTVRAPIVIARIVGAARTVRAPIVIARIVGGARTVLAPIVIARTAGRAATVRARIAMERHRGRLGAARVRHRIRPPVVVVAHPIQGVTVELFAPGVTLATVAPGSTDGRQNAADSLVVREDSAIDRTVRAGAVGATAILVVN